MPHKRHIDAPIVDYHTTDGDTIYAAIGAWLPCRIHGIDTPELRDERQRAAALVSHAYTRRWMDEAKLGNVLMMRSESLGLYARVDVVVYRVDTGEELGEYLVEVGVAVRSDGTKRHEWTDEELRRIESLAL